MPTEKKRGIIEELEKAFSKATVGVVTSCKGLTAPEMNVLRRKLRDTGVEFKVVKNTLARIAADEAGSRTLVSVFEGPTAIAFGYGDITQPAKTLLDYIRTLRESPLTIKGGFLGSRLMTSDEVTTLATLPPREVLIAKVLGGMQSPIANLVSYLAYPIRGLMGVLEARSKILQKEEAK